MIRFCKTCGVKLSKHCRSDYCNHHRDRTGSNNSFFGKTHKKETLDAANVEIVWASDYKKNPKKVLKEIEDFLDWESCT